MEKVKVGVVGVGYFGQFHAEKYAKMEGAELVGVVDVDASRAKEIAKRYRTQAFLDPSHDEFGRRRTIWTIEVMDDRMAEVIRAKTGAERLRIANDMYEDARSMLLCHLRAEHPGWNEDRVIREAARRLSHGAV